MSLRGRVIIRYAAADAIAGGIEVVGSSAQGRRRELVVERLEEPGFVAFAELLTLAESIRRAPDGIVARRYSATRPEFTACAEELEVALRPFLASDACLHDVLGDVAAVLLNHPRAT